MNLLFRERPEGDRTEQSYLDALLTRTLDALLGNTCRTTEGYDNIVGIIHLLGFITNLGFTDFSVFLLKSNIALLHHLRLEFQRGHDVDWTTLRTADGSPRTFLRNLLLGTSRLDRRQNHLLHHLTNDTIAQNHRRIAILKGKRKGEINEISHLLNRSRSQHNHIIVAVTTTAGSLEIITLGWLDGTQTRTATLHIDDNARNLSTCHVRDTLLHQSHTRT